MATQMEVLAAQLADAVQRGALSEANGIASQIENLKQATATAAAQAQALVPNAPAPAPTDPLAVIQMVVNLIIQLLQQIVSMLGNFGPLESLVQEIITLFGTIGAVA